MSPEQDKQPYFGSVLFFKHLILAAETSPAETPQEEEGPDAPAAETPAYTELYPELYAPKAEVGSGDIEKSVYLTFDDGPSPRTEEILKVLDTYGVKATFFVVGSSDETGLERLRAITAAGFTFHPLTAETRGIVFGYRD